MRILTESELDQIFGGTDTYAATTLPGVTVNATVAANPNIPFSLNSANSMGGVPTYESGGTTAPCYAAYYYSLTQTPNFKHLHCYSDHYTKDGMGIPADVSLIILNDMVSGSASGGSIDMTQLHVQDKGSYPQGSLILSGLYQYNPGHYKSITFSAGAFQPVGTPYQYKDAVTGASETWSSGLTAAEHAVFVVGHEAAHAHGITDEIKANGFGFYAVEQFRANPNACP